MSSSVIAIERKAYSIAEVAQQHGVSKAFVHLEIRRGRLRVLRLGRRRLISEEAIRDWWLGETK